MPTIRRSFCSPLVDCCESKNDSSNARVNDSLGIVKTTISFTGRDCIDYILNSIQFFLAALVAQLVRVPIYVWDAQTAQNRASNKTLYS